MYCDYNELMSRLRALYVKYSLTSHSNDSDERLADMYKDTISLFESSFKLSKDECNQFFCEMSISLNDSMRKINNK